MHFKKDAFAWINFEWLEVSVCNMDLVTWVEIQWTDMSALLLRLQGWLLKVIHGVRPLFWVIEQPTSSQMFLMPTLKPMLDLWQLAFTTTWLGCFGHLLQKGTKLMTNLKDDQKKPSTTGLFLIMTHFLSQSGMKCLVLGLFASHLFQG